MLPASAGKSRYSEDLLRFSRRGAEELEEVCCLLARLEKETNDVRAAEVFEEIRKCAVIARAAADTVVGMAEHAKREKNPRTV